MADPTDDTCPLCYELMHDEDDEHNETASKQPKKILTCNHKFHEDCIDDYMLFQKRHRLPTKCPMCQRPIDRTDYPKDLDAHLPVVQPQPLPPP